MANLSERFLSIETDRRDTYNCLLDELRDVLIDIAFALEPEVKKIIIVPKASFFFADAIKRKEIRNSKQ